MKENAEIRLNRAFEILRNKGLAHARKDVARQMMAAEATVSKAFNGDKKYLTENFLERFNSAYGCLFNESWLLYGTGSELSPTSSVIQTNHNGDNINGVNVSIGNGMDYIPSRSQDVEESLPVIPVEIYKETNVDVMEYVSKNQERLIKKPKVPLFPEYTAFYQVYDESMADKFKAGDMLALKPIQWEWLISGEPLVINTFSYGLLLRRVKYDRGNDYVTCVSENRDVFPDFDIPTNDIANTFRIVGMIRFNV